MDVKNQIINNYLTQQLMAPEPEPTTAIQQIEIPDALALQKFKTHVNNWMEMDNNIKKLQSMTRERNNIKKQLTTEILKFMNKYNIEDLNTKDGKLRYKVVQSKVSPNQNDIKERIMSNYDKVNNLEELTSIVFEKKKVEKHSLRRLGAQPPN